jgi:hypothetical protein
MDADRHGFSCSYNKRKHHSKDELEDRLNSFFISVHACLSVVLFSFLGIKKHRADVFGLAATLPAEAGPELPDSVIDALASFLRAFPTDSMDWSAIIASLRSTLGIRATPESLRAAIQTYFGILS